MIPEQSKTNRLILVFVFLKLLIQLLALHRYGFHRDEFLYLAETKHMSWGYLEVPPFTSFVGWVATHLFGDGIFAVRIFSLIAGTLVLYLALKIIQLLGGQKWAIIIGAIAMMISPAYLRSTGFFMPVVFNILFWTSSCFFIVKLIRTQNRNYWYYLGIIGGIGLLNKYSILFYFSGLLLGFLISKERLHFKSKEPYLAILIGLLIAAPNLWWQFSHNFPIVHHMQELNETQLVNMNPGIFVVGQIVMLWLAFLIWIPGIYAFFGFKSLLPYKIFSVAYLVLITILLIGRGKDYYSLGAYPVLIAGGAIFWEKILKERATGKFVLIGTMILLSVPIIPYGIPILPIEQARTYMGKAAEIGFNSPLRWEDGEYYELPQDYADMHGWEEMVHKVAKLYHSFSEEEKASLLIEGGGYHHAGPINYYREKYDLPESYSFSANFILWIDENAKFDHMIIIDDWPNLDTSVFSNVVLIDSIENPYARDPGYIIYRSEPKVDLPALWNRLVKERRAWLE